MFLLNFPSWLADRLVGIPDFNDNPFVELDLDLGFVKIQKTKFLTAVGAKF